MIVTELERRMSMRVTGYNELRSKVPEIIREHDSDPKIWLDTGCGTGAVIRDSIKDFSKTQFVLADPSSENIEECKKVMNGEQRCLYVNNPTDKLNFGDETLDVITAILCHHYYQGDGRRIATENCFRMLKKHAIYVTVEHVRYDEDQEKMDSLWKSNMLKQGLPEEFADEMLSRRYHEFYPLTEEEFISMLKDVGFSQVEVFWKTCSDIGIKAVK